MTLLIANHHASLPIAYRLYLPEIWANDAERREKAHVPEDVEFRTKPQIALAQIEAAAKDGVARSVALTDAAYGCDRAFRAGVTALGLNLCGGRAIDAVGLASRRRAIAAQAPERPRAQAFAPATRRRSSADFGQRACDAPARRGLERSRVARRLQPALVFALRRARVRPASPDHKLVAPHPVEWLVVEWPEGEAEPTKCWLSTLPEDMPLAVLVDAIKLRWRIERNYEELKSDFGLA